MGIGGGQPSLETAASEKKVIRTVCNSLRGTLTRDLHMAFKIPYLYDFVTKLCRQQATVTLNHANVNIRKIGQGMAQHSKKKKKKKKKKMMMMMMMMMISRKRLNAKNTYEIKIHIYIYIYIYILVTQTRTVTFYKTEPSSSQGGNPKTDKTATVLTTAKIWS
jgi:hypothetical protein